ncbi:MAG: hypothetical protein LC676_07465 [Loktanella sp.]|nr:hypothetical protein [Loktanella sp.]
MPKNDKTSAGWREKLDQLEQSQATAQRALETAQAKATQVAFDGGDVEAAARQVQLHRDTVTAFEGATREAQHQLEQAESQERAAAARIERDKAQQALKARASAAEQIDAALTQLGEAHAEFEAAGKTAVAHYRAAGDAAPQRLLHGQPDALAGAMMHHAPTFHHAMRAQRSEPASRHPLAETAARMVAE